MKTDYSLICLGSQEQIGDVDMPMASGLSSTPAFLRTVYAEKSLKVGRESEGLYRFANWLPIGSPLEGSSSPYTYKSSGLAASLGLDELYITFSGFWPARGVEMKSGTFKECEAYTVCARLPHDFSETLVVASAGNTARAFINVCSSNSIPLVVVVPSNAMPNLWIDHDVNPCVQVVMLSGDADYADSIEVAKAICSHVGFRSEGGAQNVARRDGMGTTVLSAVFEIGRIPDYYFQAVGSGTGAIAAWEANLRLIEDGRFGDNKMRLMISQNDPFLVIYDSWQAGSRSLVDIEPDEARRRVAATHAHVLANRKPPYGIIGGVYDALIDTGGDVLSVKNSEAIAADELFFETEGIDIAPAASVAVASLRNSVLDGSIGRNDVISLNVTGGGFDLIRETLDVRQVGANLTISADHPYEEAAELAVQYLRSEHRDASPAMTRGSV